MDLPAWPALRARDPHYYPEHPLLLNMMIQDPQATLAAAAVRATAHLFNGRREERVERALSAFADAIGARYLQVVPIAPEDEVEFDVDSDSLTQQQIRRLMTGDGADGADTYYCAARLRSAAPVRFLLVAMFEAGDAPADRDMLDAFAEALTPLVDFPIQLEHVEQRLRIDQALVETSHMLVASDEIDFERLLRTTAEATGVDSAYFVRLPLDTDVLTSRPANESDNTVVFRWTQNQEFIVEAMPTIDDASLEADPAAFLAGARDSRGTGRVNAVPVLSSDDRLFGYLGFEYGDDLPRWRDEDVRVLGILGDMLATYFGRKAAERALQESEERWRRLVDHHPDPILLTAAGLIRYVNTAGVRTLGARTRSELLGTSLFDFVSAEMFDILEERGRVLEQGGTPEPMEHEMIRFDGEERIVESSSVPIRYEGQSLILTVMRDVTEARLAEEGYRTFVETITEAICRIDLDRLVSREASLELQRKHITDFGYVAECNGVMVELLRMDREEIEGKTFSTVFPHIRDSLLDEFIEKGYRLKNKEIAIRRPGEKQRHLVVNVVGTLERGKLSRIWCSCIEVTERVEMERRIVGALEEQQQKIGRDLHDGVGQLLTGVRMLSQNLADRLVGEEHGGGDVAQKISTFAAEASKHIRDIYRGLTPAQLYHEGLSATLSELAHNIDSLPNIRCQFVHVAGADVDDREKKLHLFRIAQEAVNNALKHASPKQISIYLGRDGGDLVLAVQDDGVGLRNDGNRPHSIGLDSMRYRAVSIGATLQIEPGAEGGTLIQCRLPNEV